MNETAPCGSLPAVSLLRRPFTPWVLLAAFVAVLLAMSWQRWGTPTGDPGLDLTVAADWVDGVFPYRDVRYWYGPLGIAGLAGAFAVLGTSLWTVYLFGFLQTLVIAELWRRLARRWLPGAVVAAGLAAVLAIGFSGSLFNFIVPHTASATTGLMALLATMLAAANRRWAWAGAAVGAAALTRPEFLAFAVAALGGGLLGVLRDGGAWNWKPAIRAGLLAVPGVLLVGGVGLWFFASKAGWERLITENLFPVEFLGEVGTSFEDEWHPNDLAALGTLLLRGVIVAGGALALLRAAEAWQTATGAGLGTARRLRITATPLVAFVAVVIGTAVAATVLAAISGDAGEPVRLVADDAARLLLPMTALAAIGLAVLLVAGVRWGRAERSPLGGSWPADLALIAGAAACALRAYHQFSTDIYATYYAPPVVLVAVILLWRAADRLPARRQTVVGLIVGLAAVVLAAHAYIGRYRDFTFVVHAPNGTYKAFAEQGPNVQKVIDLVAPETKPGDTMLVLPQEAGFHMLLGTRPALYDATLLPGTLPSRAADEAAAARLAANPPRFVIDAARSFELWGKTANGVDVNVALMDEVKRRYCVAARFGDTQNLAPSDLPATAFTVYRLRAPGQTSCPAPQTG